MANCYWKISLCFPSCPFLFLTMMMVPIILLFFFLILCQIQLTDLITMLKLQNCHVCLELTIDCLTATAYKGVKL